MIATGIVILLYGYMLNIIILDYIVVTLRTELNIIAYNLDINTCRPVYIVNTNPVDIMVDL